MYTLFGEKLDKLDQLENHTDAINKLVDVLSSSILKKNSPSTQIMTINSNDSMKENINELPTSSTPFVIWW